MWFRWVKQKLAAVSTSMPWMVRSDRWQGFLVDPGDHRVTHVLLQEGHFWGRKEVAIPVSAVTGVENGIRLNMTKKQIEDLPPAH